MHRTTWPSSEEPSLIQRHQSGEPVGEASGIDASPLDKARTAASHLTSSADSNADATADLLTLRSTSHTLSEENKTAKQQLAAVKAKVDEARLQLENRRLEERELMEEIRRESGE